MGAPAPLAGEPAPRSWFSVHVDNFDQGQVVLKSAAGEHAFKPSDEQLALRAAYASAGVVRDPAKAAEGVDIWESLGAQLRGDEGLVGTTSRRRALRRQQRASR